MTGTASEDGLMSGDIEDFLRRAAERRQARQANRPAPPSPPARPEYSDARRERAPQARADDDELIVAEVVEDPLSRKLAELRQAQAQAQAVRQAAAPTTPVAQRAGVAERAAARAQAQRSPGLAPVRPTPAASVTTAAALP